ncbi:C6 finger domain-containing protein [Phlyctema vagabunda]|uniref:C6 finger domain-containing protein n=1 Tax=Phlyctema vagabunda TaxID=108571 RepID=A0ABR4P1X8_9HELO
MTESSSQSSATLPNGTSCPSVIIERSPSDKRGPIRPPTLSSASSYTDLPYLFGIQDPTMLAPKPDSQPKPNNRRRKSAQDPQRVKHRRTRSGCYTCRNRRVKCDETRPTCERCRKGGRECLYPPPKEPSSKTKGSGSKLAKGDANESAGSSSDDDDDELDAERLDSIPDEDEELDADDRRASVSTSGTHRTGTSQPSIAPKGLARHGSETPSLVQDKGNSPTPSTEGSIGYTAYQATISSRPRTQKSSSIAGSDTLRSDWTHLPQDLQYYLEYFYENLTHHHYSLKYDPCNFLHSLFLDAALRNEALLYAVVGFSAFQATLHDSSGKIQDFLQYYNKAVSLLLRSLKRGERHGIGTLLAILQLATIEVRFASSILTRQLTERRNTSGTGSIYSATKRQPLKYSWNCMILRLSCKQR